MRDSIERSCQRVHAVRAVRSVRAARYYSHSRFVPLSLTGRPHCIRKQQCWLIALLTASRRATCCMRASVLCAFHPAVHARRTLQITAARTDRTARTL